MQFNFLVTPKDVDLKTLLTNLDGKPIEGKSKVLAQMGFKEVKLETQKVSD